MTNKKNNSKLKVKSPITIESKKKNVPNQIDIEFNDLIDFIKLHNLDQMKESIKHNFTYFSKNDNFNYHRIISFYNEHKLWGTIDLDNLDYELINRNAEALVEHRLDIEWLYHRLGDYRSKRILLTILYYWLMIDFRKVEKISDKTFDQYFDLDLIKCTGNEVFVDIGSYIGDTLINYTKMFGKNGYKRIYCYEIVPANIKYIKKNIELFNLKNIIVREKGVSDKKGTLFLSSDDVSSTSKLSEDGSIEVETVTIDDDIDEKVTFIKMDIEGAEEQALLGCRQKIWENHPKLALSAYHNNHHLWQLARIIDEIDPTYQFYLRYYGGPALPTEYLLYAI